MGRRATRRRGLKTIEATLMPRGMTETFVTFQKIPRLPLHPYVSSEAFNFIVPRLSNGRNEQFSVFIVAFRVPENHLLRLTQALEHS